MSLARAATPNVGVEPQVAAKRAPVGSHDLLASCFSLESLYPDAELHWPRDNVKCDAGDHTYDNNWKGPRLTALPAPSACLILRRLCLEMVAQPRVPLGFREPCRVLFRFLLAFSGLWLVFRAWLQAYFRERLSGIESTTRLENERSKQHKCGHQPPNFLRAISHASRRLRSSSQPFAPLRGANDQAQRRGAAPFPEAD